MQEQPLFFTGPYALLFPSRASRTPFVALLIDGDTIHLTEAQLVQVLQAAGSLGEIAIRRVYGNWDTTAKSVWKELALRYAMKLCAHMHGVPGKNATDIALVIDAMDLFYSGMTNFCLVTSDSDSTPLVARLRASGCQVVGIGKPAKNASLISSCNAFVPLDELSPERGKETAIKQGAAIAKKKGKETPTKQEQAKKAVVPKKKSVPPISPAAAKITKPSDDPELTQVIEQAFDTITARQQRETVLLVDVIGEMKEIAPALKPKDYGKTNLPYLIKERTDLFVFRQIEQDGKKLDEMWRRDKNDVQEHFADKEEKG